MLMILYCFRPWLHLNIDGVQNFQSLLNYIKLLNLEKHGAEGTNPYIAKNLGLSLYSPKT